MKSYQQFFAELKRRHVFKVMAVYGGVAFGLIQLADPLAKALLLPDAFLTYVVAILMLGFPLALVLAWAFEVTPDGVRRTEVASAGEIESIIAAPASRRWPDGLMALAGLGALLGGAWWAGLQTGRGDAEGVVAVATARADSLQLAYTDPESDGRPSIAVLPFVNMSGETEQEYFSDGITEEILNTLARIRQLRVAARTSAFAFKGRQLDLRQVGDSLGVEYLLEGSVRKAGDQLRITAQLIDAADGSHLWSDRYDRELGDVFAIQTEIAEAIAEELRVPLGLAEGRTLVQATGDLEAYDLYLAGRARMRERGQSVFEAARLFEAAAARDANWAPAWAGLAESLALAPHYGPGPDEPPETSYAAYWERKLDAAEAAAERALALDPDNASATVALANARRDRWEWDAAEETYLRALRLDPDSFEAHQQYAELLAYVGRTAEATLAADRALALDRSPVRLNVAGYVALHDGRPEDAIHLLTEAIDLDPEGRVHFLHGLLVQAYVTTGRWSEARDLVLRAIRRVAPEKRPEIERTWPPVDGPPIGFDADLVTDLNDVSAVFAMAIGEPETALGLLGELTERWPPYGHSVVFFAPAFDPLRDDPRFLELMKIRGLEGRRPIRSSDVGNDTP